MSLLFPPPIAAGLLQLCLDLPIVSASVPCISVKIGGYYHFTKPLLYISKLENIIDIYLIKKWPKLAVGSSHFSAQCKQKEVKWVNEHYTDLPLVCRLPQTNFAKYQKEDIATV